MPISNPTRRPAPRPAWTRLVIPLTIAIVLGGCATGARPTLTSEPLIDDSAAAVDRLLDRPATRFTATYTVKPTTNSVEGVEAVVMKSGERMRVTIGHVDYLSGQPSDEPEVTCLDEMNECFSGTLNNYISNLNITSDFWNQAMKARLRTDVGRNIGTIEEYGTEIAATTATCVDVRLDGGTSSYCVHPAGVLARYNGADTHIELVDFTDSVDETALAPVAPVS